MSDLGILILGVFIFLVGYCFGRWVGDTSTSSCQEEYWRYRYYQTLQDLADLEEEQQWLEDWCNDK